MPTSYDLNLSADVVPRWPHRCVRCEKPSPDSVFTFLSEHDGVVSTVVSGNLFKSRPKVFARACEPCVQALKRERFIRNALFWVSLIIAVILALQVYKLTNFQLRGLIKTIALMTMTVILMLPYHLFYAMRPSKVNASRSGKDVSYEFCSRTYFVEFAAANNMLTIGMKAELAPDLVVAPELAEEKLLRKGREAVA